MYHSQQEYSNFDLIPAAQVIATAKLRIGLDTNEFDLYFEIEIQNYLKNFGSLGTVTVLTKPVCIDDCRIQLPRGIRRFIGIRHDFCLEGDAVDPSNNQPIPLFVFTRGFLLDYGNCGLFDSYYQMQDGYIFLRTNAFDGLNVSICYEGWNTADDNNLRVYENYESCLAWKLAELFLLTNPSFYGPGLEYIAERNAIRFQKKYSAEKQKIRADEQRTAWKNDSVKMAVIQNRVHISDYRTYWNWGGYGG